MVYSKTKKILLILLCIFVLFFPFLCVAGLCADTDEVNIERIDGIRINPNGNFFITGQSTGYFELENGFIYHINYRGSGVLYMATSNDTPKINGTYNYLTSLQGPFQYDYISVGDNFLFFDFTQATTSITVTREPVIGMDYAVSDLVSNVGVNSIWNIFNNSINYIYIVVLVAFGIFIVALVIRKITKGKEGF